MRYGRLGFALIGALTVALSPAATYGQNIDGPGQYLPQRASGAGRWESTRAAGDKRDWQIEVERFDDDSIAGSIIVIGSPSLHKARIEGRVEGAEVYGVLVADGGMGSMLYARGIPLDTSYDALNLTHRDLVRSVHEEFLEAGAVLLETNTFGANRTRLAPHGLAGKVRAINVQGARLARRVAGRKAFVAGSVGPLGKPADGEKPLPVKEKEAVFREQVEALAEGGVDLFVLETFLDLEELLAAVRAARATTDLPVVASLAFVDVTGTTGGVPLLRAVRALESAGVHAVGVNCGRGFADALKVVEEMVRRTDLPVAAMPNAGLPDFVDGRFVYRATSAYMASMAAKMAGSRGSTWNRMAASRLETAREKRVPMASPIAV